MKASEVITKLQDMIEEYGDLDVLNGYLECDPAPAHPISKIIAYDKNGMYATDNAAQIITH